MDCQFIVPQNLTEVKYNSLSRLHCVRLNVCVNVSSSAFVDNLPAQSLGDARVALVLYIRVFLCYS